MFAEVKEAYEVLVDDHERAWYDSHKDQILRGQDVDPDHDDGMSYLVAEGASAQIGLA